MHACIHTGTVWNVNRLNDSVIHTCIHIYIHTYIFVQFGTLIGLMIASYIRAWLTDPGSVPEGWVPK